MHRTRSISYGAAWLASFLSLTATFAGDQRNEPALIEALRTAPPADKALACKRLATIGTKAAVPELAPLLADEQLASWARITLEAIPDPAADEALRNAMGSLTGKLLIGTINSIAVRKDSAAVDLLANRLNDRDVDVASAAAVALGCIGNDAAAKILRQSLAGAPGPVLGAVAEGCIRCAEQRMQAGRTSEAAEIYDEVRRCEAPKPRKLEATRGAIVARKAAGVPLLMEQLRSSDRAFFQIGLSTARELAGREASDALAAELARTSPDRAALLLNVLADRRDPSVLPAVLNAASSGEKQSRVAAIGVIGRLGDVSSVAPLLEIAVDSDAELAEAAKAAIVGLADKDVDAAIAERLSAAEGKVLAALIDLVGQRRIDATESLIKALEHGDESVRSAALTALGATIGPQDLAVLVSLVINPKNPTDEQVAQRALRAACLRMPDREACAAELAAAMSRASNATQVQMLEILGALGGQKALEIIDLAMKSNNAPLQDAGSRVLGEWMSVDAAPVLFDLAKNAADDTYRRRALRGYIRLARQFPMPNEQRAEICEKAIAAANRIEEQQLALAVLERYPNRDTLKVAVKATHVPALREHAAKVTLAIAEKLGDDGAAVRDSLSKTGLEPVKVDIVKAEYGSGAAQKDVTAILQKCVDDLPLIMLPSATYNDSFGGDPAPGIAKTLKIHYLANGKAGEAAFAENALIALPMP